MALYDCYLELHDLSPATGLGGTFGHAFSKSHWLLEPAPPVYQRVKT